MSVGRIGFIGAGKMATALAKGFMAAGCCTAAEISASDVYPSAAAQFAESTHAKVSPDNAGLVAASDILFLSVKPQNMAGVLTELRPLLEDRHLIVSIAAGITLATIEGGLGAGRRVIRVMPNTPCLVNESASGYALGASATPEDERVLQQLLSAVGLAVKVPEYLLNAVTGLSGSGPAFVYQMIEALSDGGVRVGLPRDVATRLAAQTLLGAAKMVLETGEHPGQLKDAVTSPGGTTIAGLHALEQGGLRASLMNAVVAATQRAIELGKS